MRMTSGDAFVLMFNEGRRPDAATELRVQPVAADALARAAASDAIVLREEKDAWSRETRLSTQGLSEALSARPLRPPGLVRGPGTNPLFLRTGTAADARLLRGDRLSGRARQLARPILALEPAPGLDGHCAILRYPVVAARHGGGLCSPGYFVRVPRLTNYRHIHSVADERLERTVNILQEHALKVFETIERGIAETNEIVRGMSDDEIVADEARLHLGCASSQSCRNSSRSGCSIAMAAPS